MIDRVAIENNLFVEIIVDDYKMSPTDSYQQEILRFGDRLTPTIIDSNYYHGLGRLVSISESTSELRSSQGELTITISGIPNERVYEIVNSRFKGSPVKVQRVLFDPETGDIIEKYFRYTGFVNNYSLREDFDFETRTSTNTIILICNSAVDVFQNKTTGRKTNPVSQKKFYPNDKSMDRVPALKNTKFDFGAKV